MHVVSRKIAAVLVGTFLSGWSVPLVAQVPRLGSSGSGLPTIQETLARGEQLLLSGDYEGCIQLATDQITKGVAVEEHSRLKGEAEIALGRYGDAVQTALDAVGRYQSSIRLRWLAMRAAPFTSHSALRAAFSEQISQLVQNAPWRYSDAENLVTLGEFLLAEGADAKQVQEAFFRRARRNSPHLKRPVMALANLALEKRDFALAAELLRPAQTQFPDDPEVLFGLARAVAESDPKQGHELVQKTLQHNPRFVPALLMLAENQIDGEQYSSARELLAKALEVNPVHADALALQSLVVLLEGDEEESMALRRKALAQWGTNPRVDHLIGRKLSEKYRFEEGSRRQRMALEMDPAFLPAKKQLSQDLLRLGQEEEGWKLADEVYAQDEYDVAAYNLVTLRDELTKFRTLTAEGFTVRMDAHEADVYGDRVLALLTEARRTLCPRYQLNLQDDILVEIFPKPADFAVRTFGLPAAGGYLGVCFGDVITANSPASQGAMPVNWQSVLWHEFAHVVTLNKTHNRMPRWLSEGISVYEERQRDSSWGERMTPGYRKLILDKKYRPIGELSEAFLNPEGNLLFAYYQSSMVVEYLINQYGLESLLAVLDDLGIGISIQDAIERRTAPLPELDAGFAKYIEAQAAAYGWAVDWDPAEVENLAAGPDAARKLQEWAAANPRHYVGLKTCGELLVKLNQPDAALPVLEQATGWFSLETGPDSAWLLLARLYRQRGETGKEVAALRQLASIDDDAASALLRLMELGIQNQDWKSVRSDARKLLAIRPLIPEPHDALARACETLGPREEAIQALRARLFLPSPDMADLHYRLAVQLREAGQMDEARRHVLQAIEDAPRYRDALSLLLEIRSDRAAAEE